MAEVKSIHIEKVDLKKLCKKAGISLYRLAKEAGISYEHLLRINKGMYSMTPEYWNKLKKVLDSHQ